MLNVFQLSCVGLDLW